MKRIESAHVNITHQSKRTEMPWLKQNVNSTTKPCWRHLCVCVLSKRYLSVCSLLASHVPCFTPFFVGVKTLNNTHTLILKTHALNCRNGTDIKLDLEHYSSTKFSVSATAASSLPTLLMWSSVLPSNVGTGPKVFETRMIDCLYLSM